MVVPELGQPDFLLATRRIEHQLDILFGNFALYIGIIRLLFGRFFVGRQSLGRLELAVEIVTLLDPLSRRPDRKDHQARDTEDGKGFHLAKR
jgi:hypothetical protein